MLTEERHSKIYELVNINKSVTLSEICETLDISESTARRDLTEMAEKGLLIRVHGGAIVNNESFLGIEADVEEKSKKYNDEKLAIAKYAASLIMDGDFVFMDAGTTTEKMIDYISGRDVTFVTNAITHGLKLAKKGYKVYVPEGRIKSTTEAIVGAACIESLKNFNFQKCFLGVNGISLKKGLSTPDKSEAMIKETVIDNSKISYVLADHSKFDHIAAINFSALDRVTIITDKLSDGRFREETEIKEVM